MHLFAPLALRSVTLRNRIAVSPMCMYPSSHTLRDPHFPLRAAKALGHEGPWPRQYLRAR